MKSNISQQQKKEKNVHETFFVCTSAMFAQDSNITNVCALGMLA